MTAIRVGRRLVVVDDEFIAHFWSKTEPSGTCHEWTLSTNTHGYGQVMLPRRLTAGRMVLARTHQVAWQLIHGPLPVGMCVCHRCDNRPCCNPDDLFLGTKADNAHDMVAKGRSARGERNGLTRLTNSNVIDIRARLQSGIPRRVLASEFSVNVRTISRIALRQVWGHLPDQSAGNGQERAL